jgi:phage protein U
VNVLDIISDVRTRIAANAVPQPRRPMYAQLGAITFFVVGPITGLESKQEFNFAQLDIIAGKPRLQSIGDGLEELTLRLSFHRQFCDPAAMYSDLKDAASKKEALPLVFANGQVAGRFVISEIGDSIDETTEQGDVTSRSTTITLMEWVEATPLEVKSRARKAAAKKAVAAAPKKKAPAPLVPQPEESIDSLLRRAMAVPIPRHP